MASLWRWIDAKRGGRGSAAARGRRGERLAARVVRRSGVRIVHRNLRVGADEIDLLGRVDGERTLVLVEVKSRGPRDPCGPARAIGPAKRRRLVRAATRLRSGRRYRGWAVRYDVVEVRLPAADDGHGRTEVRHLVDAFRPEG